MSDFRRLQNLPPPPVFGVVGGNDINNLKPSIISLDDIFDELITGNVDQSRRVQYEVENKHDHDNADEDTDENSDDDVGSRKRSRSLNRSMTDEQRVERRERNREHAKRSRVRKKFLLESLQQSVHALQEENENLKFAIRDHFRDDAEDLLKTCSIPEGESIIASDPCEATRKLDDPDYSLVKALQTAQQNFVISDPSLPDNPIIYASQGFLMLTGYTVDQVLGRNCRFLQGPETDPRAVDKIRQGIEKGEDTTVVLLNYRRDGSIFWNQFFVAALRDGDGNIVNYLGVQCKVSDEYAEAVVKNYIYDDLTDYNIVK